MSCTYGAFIGFYPTNNLQATYDFYVGTLGLKLARDQGTCHIYSVADGGYLGFCLRQEVQISSQVVLILVTDGVDDVYQTLVKAGVMVESEPKQSEQYGIYHFYAHGPMGERVEIQRFDKGLVI